MSGAPDKLTVKISLNFPLRSLTNFTTRFDESEMSDFYNTWLNLSLYVHAGTRALPLVFFKTNNTSLSRLIVKTLNVALLFNTSFPKGLALNAFLCFNENTLGGAGHPHKVE